jgi:hypothetical protein
VKQEAFSKWGIDKGLADSWTLTQLDGLSYDQFLAYILPQFPLKTKDQLAALIQIGGSKIRNDQSAFYKYLFPQNLPYKEWDSQLIKTVLSEEAFLSLCQYIGKVKTKKPILNWCNVFMRHALHDALYLRDLHQQLTPLVEKVLQRRLTPTYSYLSMYGENGICPPHRDKPECQWTLDLCVKQDKPWPLSVESGSFFMKENEALIYSGTDQLHWRDKIHSGGFCDLVFFHFKEN